MNIKTIRIPEELEEAMDYVAQAEKIEKSQSLRKLANMGFETYVAKRYQNGQLTLRECAQLLKTSLSEVITLFQEMGVSGNIRTTDVMKSLESLTP